MHAVLLRGGGGQGEGGAWAGDHQGRGPRRSLRGHRGRVSPRRGHLVIAIHAVAGRQSEINTALETLHTPQSTEGPYLDHGETTNEPIEKVYVTTLVTPMGLFKYVDGGNSKITPKK